MISLVTGLPGNGKTLYALSYVKAWAEKDQRPVFYSGIADLVLPWTECKAEEWFDCPPNSIIVIDECQRIFRPRANTREVPKYVSELETHRHKGLDLVLITQHPALADSSLRRLAGRHLHVVRKWGTESATIHEWPSVKDQCDKNAGRKDSIKHHWKFDKKAFGFYKSAEVHTVKRNIPMRVIMLFILPLILIAAGWFMFHWWKGKLHPVADTVPAVMSVQSGQAGAVVKASYLDPVGDAKKFVFEQTARVKGLPQTAPRYDDMTKATSVPVPAACVSDKKRCLCFTQQATPLNVNDVLCRDIVARGYYLDFEPNGTNGKMSGAVPGVSSAGAVLVSAKDTEAVKSTSRGSQVVTIGDEDGYGVLGKHRGGSFTSSK